MDIDSALLAPGTKYLVRIITKDYKKVLRHESEDINKAAIAFASTKVFEGEKRQMIVRLAKDNYSIDHLLKQELGYGVRPPNVKHLRTPYDMVNFSLTHIPLELNKDFKDAVDTIRNKYLRNASYNKTLLYLACMFIEMSEQEKVELYYNYGSVFKNYRVKSEIRDADIDELL